MKLESWGGMGKSLVWGEIERRIWSGDGKNGRKMKGMELWLNEGLEI